MRFQLRLVAALWVASLVVIGVFAYLQFAEERQRLIAELDRRAALVSESLKEVLEPALVRGGNKAQIDRLIKKFSKPDLDLAVYDRVASMISVTPSVAKQIETPPPEVTWALTSGAVQTGFRKLDGKTLYVYADPILRDDKAAGALVVFLDASDLKIAEWERWRFNAIRFVVLAAVLALIALLVVRMSLTQPLAKMARWTKAVRRGHAIDPPEMPDESLFGPIAREVTVLAKNLQRAKAAAEEEAALRLIGQTLWTEERLKQFAKMRLGERPLVVVSNREPISHVWKDGRIQVITPASGLVTAMDPVMRACGGIWVAQASGDADRETADARGRLRVPPDDPRFTLKRVWLTPEEEAGYYYGFSNEGLWPLCHIVHNRPLFRPEDWAHYKAVNEKFAAAVLEEIAGTESPMVLIQDYHFALLPGLIKRERPDARTAIFWHIPWPNFEAFSICPWQDELLLGMLGADLIGFHTQYYCNNFLDTVERAIEARIDWERFSVTRGQHVTSVKPFPISVAPGLRGQPAHDVSTGAPREPGHHRRVPRGWRRAARLHQGPARALPGAGPLLRALPGVPRARGLRAARGAEPQHHPALPGAGGRGGRGDPGGQRDVPDQAVEAHPLPEAPPRAPRHLALLPPRRLLHGDLAARRHEPGRQGVHLGARRRGGGAHPEPVHRRVVGAAGRHPGEPV